MRKMMWLGLGALLGTVFYCTACASLERPEPWMVMFFVRDSQTHRCVQVQMRNGAQYGGMTAQFVSETYCGGLR